MGGLFHLFDFNQSSMARKVLAHKRHVGGLEAPRNSLELPIETSQGYYAVGDSVPNSYQVQQDWAGKNCHPTEASMKKLINQEMSKRSNTRHNTPSIVARLMGMDMLPLDTKSVVQPIEKRNVAEINFSKKGRERTENGSIGHAPLNPNSSRQMECNSFHRNKDRDPDRSSRNQKLGKPRPREHPQEEELQKFKKEFEAWQAARFRECASVVELDSIPRKLLAQENLNKEKRAIYSNSGIIANEKPVELKGNDIKARYHGRSGLQHNGHKLELYPDEQKEYFSLSRSTSRDFDQSPMMNCDKKLEKSSAPTRIVILKPGPDRIGNTDESWASSSGTLEERDSIEDFLEEVKERLKHELQGKPRKRVTLVRGGGIETPFSERPSEPKQIAQHIAKQVRESVTRDLGMNLLRSESTRSYRSEIQLNGSGSPEFINRDTRKFLSERLRNVLKRETHQDIPIVVNGSSRPSMLDYERNRLEQTGDNLKAGNRMNHWENVNNEAEMQTRSFRHGPDDDAVIHRESSPRNLIRSLSAPVSGTSFGKLLLEDRRILTGAHIRRKHEVTENLSVDVKKGSKEKFNLKEKVSNFKYSFTFRGRLFGRKIQSSVESCGIEHDPMKDIMSGPTVIMNLGDRHENSTEVPPSPASVCSSAHEEFFRPGDYVSPVSTPDLPLVEDYPVPHLFREISSNLNELRRQLDQLGSNGSEDTTIDEESPEVEMIELEDQAEAYIRDLLVASGFYGGSSDTVLSRWDPLARPISNRVFDKVEESYKKLAKDNEGSPEADGEKKVDHKVLLDLLNEALSTVLGPPVGMSRFRRKFMGSTMLSAPHGKKLLDCVWEIIRVHVYPPADKSCYSLDSMVARDLGSIPWSGLIDDEMNALGRDMESMIIGGLVDEIVKDMQL